MELGKKLLQARLEAGLSQRQLCGDTITRNMLSQIEHGTARPSMDTLRILAGRLGKPLSYFLEEDALLSPNAQLILQARSALQAGDAPKARLLLETFQEPNPLFQRESRFLRAQATLAVAQASLDAGKIRYAQELLQEIATDCQSLPGLERQRLMLLGQIPEVPLQALCQALPSLDEELLLRARGALAAGDGLRAARLLDAAEAQTAPFWQLLRGQAALLLQDFPAAAAHFHRAEEAFPKETALYLERCYRELEDYKQAYFYACKQR